MDRSVGIDYGKKRTGIAVSDPLNIFAQPMETVDGSKVIEFLKKYSEQETITDLIVGYPKNLDNTPAEAAKDVDAFLQQLKKAFPEIPVHLEDERFTSVLAHRAMIDGGMKAKDRKDKKTVDKISASIILQGYLDRKNGSEGGTGFAANIQSIPESRTGKNFVKRRK